MNELPVFQHFLGDEISSQHFFESYWGTLALHIKANQRSAFSPINISEIDSFLSSERLLYPYLKLVSKGSSVAFNTYRNNSLGPNTSFIDKTKLFKLMHNGYSLTINSLDKMLPGLIKFRENLSDELKNEVWINAYITPSNQQGFNKHEDDHDVFALQLEGTKVWRIYNDEGGESNDIILNKGDLLYIPKGIPHSAATVNTSSTHLTFGIKFKTYSDLLKKLCKEIETKGLLDNRLNPARDELSQDELAEFTEKVVQTIGDIDISILNEIIANKEIRGNQGFYRWSKIERFNTDDTLVKRHDFEILFRENDQQLDLIFFDKIISFPLFLKPTFEDIRVKDSFKLSDLSSPLDIDQTCKIIKRLLVEGLLDFKS